MGGLWSQGFDKMHTFEIDGHRPARRWLFVYFTS
jgi:hypothetical protein